ncbi:MAG: fructose-bisphosphate aldolase, partial [Chloroflexota bacterium]|nr:fructose-bisphosphate aldolase [Chloroflexota bacterium]
AQLRLGRLFNKQSGRSFIAAIDHGVTIGAATGAERAIETVETVIACEPDAVLIGPGLLPKTAHLFAHRGAPAPVLRADFIINDPRLKDLGEGYRVLVSPTHAAHLGAEAFIMFLIMGPEEGTMFVDNVRAISQAAEEAHKIGLPLIVEAVLWGSRIKDKRDADLLTWACRTAAELGADAIKTEWTGDVASMAKLIESVPAPVLVLGGPKSDNPETVIDATRGAMEAGAKGVTYGRNLWGADDPRQMGQRLREVIHGNVLVAS